MTAIIQKAVRWQPLSGIPETPCADFALESYETGILKATLRYSWITGNDKDLMLELSEVLSIRTFWDGDGDGLIDDPPRCAGADSRFIWPLLKIEHSKWLYGGNFDVSIHIAESLGKEPWQHYRVLTLERSLDIIARGTVHGKWVAAPEDVPQLREA
jgi:hypothetical protein